MNLLTILIVIKLLEFSDAKKTFDSQQTFVGISDGGCLYSREESLCILCDWGGQKRWNTQIWLLNLLIERYRCGECSSLLRPKHWISQLGRHTKRWFICWLGLGRNYDQYWNGRIPCWRSWEFHIICLWLGKWYARVWSCPCYVLYFVLCRAYW